MRLRSDRSHTCLAPIARLAPGGCEHRRIRHYLPALALALVWTIPSMALAAGATPHDAAGIVRFLDTDGDGRLDRHEVRDTPGMAAFLRVDADQDGFLDADELRAEGLGSHDPGDLAVEPAFDALP